MLLATLFSGFAIGVFGVEVCFLGCGWFNSLFAFIGIFFISFQGRLFDDGGPFLVVTLLLEDFFDFFMQFVLVEHLDDRLISMELNFPAVCFLLANQLLCLVALGYDHVVFSASCLADFAN